MVQTCVVTGCKKESYPGCVISFHRLPVKEDLKKKWMEALQISKNLSTYSVVCSLHFKDEDYLTKAKKRLKPEAIPTILLKEETAQNNILHSDSYQISEHKSEICETSDNECESSDPLISELDYVISKKPKLEIRQTNDHSVGDLSGSIVNNSECDLYGLLLAEKLKLLPEHSRLKLMNEIDNLVFKYKINIIQED